MVLQVAIPMAAFYIARNERAMLTSHGRVNLILASAIKQIQKGEIDWMLNSQNGVSSVVVPHLTDFLLRPTELVHLCWYSYLEMYEVVNIAQGVNIEHFKLHDDHPMRKKRVVIRRTRPVIVQYHGYSLKPSARRDTPEKKEMFAFCVLVMFKSYTNISDIRGNYRSYYDVLFDYNSVLKSGVLNHIGYEIIRNNEDRWKNKFASEASGKEYKKKMDIAARSVKDSLCPDTQIGNNNDPLIEFVSGGCDIFTQNIMDTLTLPEPNEYISNGASNLEYSYIDQTNSISVCGLNEKKISVGYKSAVHSSRDMSSCGMTKIFEVTEVQPLIDSAIDSLQNQVDYDTIRNKYVNAIGEYVLCRVSDEKPSVKVPVFASLHEVCYIFTLHDPNQRRAFIIGAVALLSSYIDDGNIPTDCVKENQVFALIQGLAGSGKSYVINAWSALAKSWGRESAVLCVAITGIAASSLGGRTIASVLCMRKSFTAEMLATKLLVIEEVRRFVFELYIIFVY